MTLEIRFKKSGKYWYILKTEFFIYTGSSIKELIKNYTPKSSYCDTSEYYYVMNNINNYELHTIKNYNNIDQIVYDYLEELI